MFDRPGGTSQLAAPVNPQAARLDAQHRRLFFLRLPYHPQRRRYRWPQPTTDHLRCPLQSTIVRHNRQLDLLEVKAGLLGNLTEIWNRHLLLHPLYSKSQKFDRQVSSDPALLVDPLDMVHERSILLDTTNLQNYSTDSFFCLPTLVPLQSL